jgi:hypothetical protein
MSKEKKMIDGYVTASGRNNWQNGSDINWGCKGYMRKRKANWGERMQGFDF